MYQRTSHEHTVYGLLREGGGGGGACFYAPVPALFKSNADPDSAFYPNADADPEPGSQTNVDLCGSKSGSWSDSQKVEFYMKIYSLCR
jgi:hypothetical protein